MIIVTPQYEFRGFGNEFFQVAKCLICAEELGLLYQAGYWKESPYDKVFNSSVLHQNSLPYYFQKIARQITHRDIVFGQEEHCKTGVIPVEIALQNFLYKKQIKYSDNYCIKINSLQPGLESIEKHHEKLYLLLSRNPYLSESVSKHLKNIPKECIRIGVHVRGGDFRKALPLGTPWPHNQWNIEISWEWYEKISLMIKNHFSQKVKFLLFTNSDNDVKRLQFIKQYDCYLTSPHSIQSRSIKDVEDIMLLANCDLIISSASWFSGWAIILGKVPFIWYPYAHGLPNYGQDRSFALTGNECSIPTKLEKLVYNHYHQRLNTNFL